MHKTPPKWVPILIVVILVSAGAVYFLNAAGASADGPLQASGTVEAVEIKVAAEISGRVAEVLAATGQTVQSGAPVLRLEGENLKAQRARAQKAVEAAERNLETAETGLALAQAALETAGAAAETSRAQAEVEALAARQGLEDLQENWALAYAEAGQQVASANRRVREAQYTLDNFTIPSNQKDMTALEAVAEMEARLDKARSAFEPYKYFSSGNTTREDLKEAMDEAQADYDSAVKRLEYETELARAHAQLTRALEEMEKLRSGPDPDQIALLEARLEAAQVTPGQAEAAVRQAEIGVDQARAALEQARAVVAQANADLDVLDVQIGNLTVYAAASGVVLSADVEPGEVIVAGSPVMVLGRLADLTITVYVPEDRYGQLKVGMPARVEVDSFPGRVFSATVIRIADEAEFTPRNVQTEEGRRTTVFAVELSLENTDELLKPGMPADVTFEN